MEEYKRPKFEVKYMPVKKTYQVNNIVKIQGEALGFAGNKVSDEKVEYRVNRIVQFPRWYHWYYPPYRSAPQEITYGETITDKTGKFNINFKAIPDEKINPKSLPVFHYKVTAKVTDINGETHSKTTTVYVGYHSMNATISIDNKIDKTLKEQHKLSIDTRNLNGEFVGAKGSIRIYKLQSPKYVLRPRPWNAPDYKLLPKEEYKKIFPHEAYENEHNPINWKQAKLVFDNSFDTKKSKEIKLKNLTNWVSGLYHVELSSIDKFGKKVKDIKRFSIHSKEDKSPPDNQLFIYSLNKKDLKAGETLELTLGSCAKKLNVFLEVEKNKKISNKHHIVLNNNKKTIKIPINKEDVGGFSLHYSYAAYNSFKSGILNIHVPYPQKSLQIETLTFRDKLKPGDEETWSFKIKGKREEKISAEILASMYDKSLDQFKPHSWRFNPNYFPRYYSNYRINSSFSFNKNNFWGNFLTFNGHKYMPIQYYDQLNWFGLYFFQRRFYRSVMSLEEADMAAPRVREKNQLKLVKFMPMEQ